MCALLDSLDFSVYYIARIFLAINILNVSRVDHSSAEIDTPDVLDARLTRCPGLHTSRLIGAWTDLQTSSWSLRSCSREGKHSSARSPSSTRAVIRCSSRRSW